MNTENIKVIEETSENEVQNVGVNCGDTIKFRLLDITDNSRKRKNGTECILCFECVNNCPKNAL